MTPAERRARLASIEQAEKEGRVADSMDVRSALLAQVKNGKITLERAQSEIARLKSDATAHGLITRNQAWEGQ